MEIIFQRGFYVSPPLPSPMFLPLPFDNVLEFPMKIFAIATGIGYLVLAVLQVTDHAILIR